MPPPVLLLFPRCEPDWPDPRKRLGLPLAVLHVARPLVCGGFDVEILDENVDRRAVDALREIKRPLFAGISCLGGGQIGAGLRLAREVRRRFCDVPIVWGGWNPTLLPHLYEDPALARVVDAFVRGRGERAALRIATRLAAGDRDLDGIAGVTWRDGGGALHRNPEGSDTDDEPWRARPLPYHLVRDPSRYIVRDGALNYMSSFGCPHRCSFCGIPAGTNVFRPLPDRVVADHLLEARRALGVDTIVFYDDNFFTSRERVLGLAQELIRREAGLQWFSNGRIEQVLRLDDAELDLLVRSGCRGVNIGYETGDQAVADRARKDTRVDRILELAPRLRAKGIHLSINFMVGLPGETEQGLARSLESLFSIHAECPDLEVCWYMFMPAPGTLFWRELVGEGVLTEPRTLFEHQRLQSLYLEHPWHYESPARCVFREWRTAHKAIAWYFHRAYAAAPPASPWLSGPFRLLRRWCRFRFERRWFRPRVDWWISYQLRRASVRLRWLRARALERGVLREGTSRETRASRGSVVPWTHGAT